MNDTDRDNVRFILSLKPEALEAWYEALCPDEQEYAMDIMRGARTELLIEAYEMSDIVEDVTDASLLLKSFTLKGEK